jgi:nicotinate-nucleotide adenylyltransferase
MALDTHLTQYPSAPRERRIGILGGTFDPIHIGHLIIAEEARVALELERIVFVPARYSPLKSAAMAASAEDRCCMVQLAIADHPAFALSRVDLDRDGPSFTVDTLRAFKAEYGPQAKLYFILGMDSLCHLRAWRGPREIVQLARLVAIARPGYETDLAALERDIPGLSQATHVITSISLGISATAIRQRVAQGLPIRYQVPAAVESYIRDHGLYLNEGATGDRNPLTTSCS